MSDRAKEHALDWRALADRATRLLTRLSAGGMLIGAALFCLSLTPSLLPRSYLVQGLLSGCGFALGYAIGWLLDWLWTYLGFRLPSERFARRAKLIAGGASLAAAIYFLWRVPDWQNSIRVLMEMPPLVEGHGFRVVLIALALAAVLIGLGDVLARVVRFVSARLDPLLPRRAAFALGLVVVALATWLIVEGLLARWALRSADQFFAELDRLAGQYESAPDDPLRSGSAASLIAWDTIGRQARIYVQSGPTREEIEAITGRPAMTPLRVMVGLRSAPSAQARADLALAEMVRIGAFDRSVLVLVMPVGTGWVDPAGIDTLEFLHRGDVASVALQYSYLTSWVSLVAEPEVGTSAAAALFSTVHEYWKRLPRETRPRLYLYGLSLGAYASQSSVRLYDVLDEPLNGALWVGPPFGSRLWLTVTGDRVDRSPAWLPLVGNSSAIRFANQHGVAQPPGAEWGPVRVVYLQYASDPIVFFDPEAWRRRPAWLIGERGPDVSPALRWYPFVTFLQLSFDMTQAQTTPIGHGHVYAPQHYFDAWTAVTEPQGWDGAELAALRARLSRSGALEDIQAGWFRDASSAPS